MSPLPLRFQGLVKRYGALQVTDSASLEIPAGEFHAIIGPNGAGKTTLVGLLSGEIPADAGRVECGNDDVTLWPIHARARAGLLRSYQITSIFEEFSARENAAFAALAATGRARGMWRPLMRDAGAALAAREALAAAGLEHRADVPACDLGYGERRQLELAMALAARPRVLLLDEPLAGMGAQESAAVVELLRSLKGHYTVLLIEHDMDAVFALADRVSVLVYGRIVFTGTPEEVQRHPDVLAAYLGDEAGSLAEERSAA